MRFERGPRCPNRSDFQKNNIGNIFFIPVIIRSIDFSVKNRIYWLVGDKYDDLLSKKTANIRGKKWRNGKKGKFSLYLGKNIILEKRAWGTKSFFDNKYPC